MAFKLKFYVYMKQQGEGCDYTIGCGQTVKTMEAESIEALEEYLASEAAAEDGRGFSFGSDYELRKCIIFPAETAHTVDVASYKKKYQQDLAKAKADAAEAKERAEFERLAAKFGKV
jgi:hypothetical protein